MSVEGRMLRSECRVWRGKKQVGLRWSHSLLTPQHSLLPYGKNPRPSGAEVGMGGGGAAESGLAQGEPTGLRGRLADLLAAKAGDVAIAHAGDAHHDLHLVPANLTRAGERLLLGAGRNVRLGSASILSHCI